LTIEKDFSCQWRNFFFVPFFTKFETLKDRGMRTAESSLDPRITHPTHLNSIQFNSLLLIFKNFVPRHCPTHRAPAGMRLLAMSMHFLSAATAMGEPPGFRTDTMLGVGVEHHGERGRLELRLGVGRVGDDETRQSAQTWWRWGQN
jgi:hypothetical protein